MGFYHNIENILNHLYKFTLCKIGAHRVAEYDDKFREGDFYCKICQRHWKIGMIINKDRQQIRQIQIP